MNTPTQTNLAQHTLSRHVPSKPCRVLDAPGVLDDYYLNPLSWSKENVVAVGLGPNVFLWDATTHTSKQLLSVSCRDGYIASVCWCTLSGKTHYITVGTSGGLILLVDSIVDRVVQRHFVHSSRVSALAWSANNMLSSGSRDSSILNFDPRSSQDIVSSYSWHKGDLCGLSWS